MRINWRKWRNKGDLLCHPCPCLSLLTVLSPARLLLKDYLLARSQCERKIIQIGSDARRLLVANEYFTFSEQDFGKRMRIIQSGFAERRNVCKQCIVSAVASSSEGWTSCDNAYIFSACCSNLMLHVCLDIIMQGSDNLRLDVFHVDREKPSIRCARCKLFHPPVEYILEKKKQEESEKVLSPFFFCLRRPNRISLLPLRTVLSGTRQQGGGGTENGRHSVGQLLSQGQGRGEEAVRH